jgi:hypothetical protein
MPTPYFSGRERGARPRILEDISDRAWGGIRAAVLSRASNGSFAQAFPIPCSDGAGVYECDSGSFYAALESRVADERWSMESGRIPPTLAILDAIAYCYTVVAEPIQRDFHGFFKHFHLTFDVDRGRESFRSDINEVFARNV